MRWIIAFLLMAGPLFAQDARVLQLSDNDSSIARAKYEALQKAQSEWDHFQEELKQKYLTVPKGDPDAGNTILSGSITSFGTICPDQIVTLGSTQTVSAKEISNCHVAQKAEEEKREAKNPTKYQRAGWESGFVFSKDFKFLVPKPEITTVRADRFTYPIATW